MRDHGIAFITKCSITSDLKCGVLKVLNVPDLDLKRTMYISVHKKRMSFPLVQELIDFLRNDGVGKAKMPH